MELTVKKNTVRLIEAFQARHKSPLWSSGKDKVAALQGALMSVNTYLNDEAKGLTLLDSVGKGKFEPFSMKTLFEQAAASQNKTDTNVNLVSLPNVEIGPIHSYLKSNKILGEGSTAGQALDLAMAVAHEVADRSVAIKHKNGVVQHTMVFI